MAKIGLISPSFFNYDLAIEKEIKAAGHSVIRWDDRPSNTNFSKIVIRLKLTLFIHNLIRAHRENVTQAIIAEKCDTLLVINPEIFNSEMLASIQKELPKIKFIFYFWDSIKNKSNLKDLLAKNPGELFYSFDPTDVKIYPSLKFYPLFFESLFSLNSNKSKKTFDVSFVGSFHSNRENLLLLKNYKELNSFLHIYIQGPLIKLMRSLPFLIKPRHFFNFWKNTVTYSLKKQDVAEIFKKSFVVIDYQHPNQAGLTCRTFEALASGCRLMTTNKNITTYDFYDPDMIYIMKNEADISLDFIKRAPLDTSVKRMEDSIQKYSLTKWVKHILVDNLV